MDILTVFYAPMRVLMERPYLALVPAVAFALGYRASRRARGSRATLLAAALWALYGAYETYMYFWSKTVIAPIRVDLLLLGPILYVVTVAGILGWWRGAREHRSEPAA